MKPTFVRIQSTATINVTPGLHMMDVTDEKAYVADKLRVSPTWVIGTVLIRQGVGNYPAEIAEWPTVKALVKDGVFTISEAVGEITDAERALYEKFAVNKEEMNIKTNVTETNTRKIQEQKRKFKEVKLEDIAGE